MLIVKHISMKKVRDGKRGLRDKNNLFPSFSRERFKRTFQENVICFGNCDRFIEIKSFDRSIIKKRKNKNRGKREKSDGRKQNISHW